MHIHRSKSVLSERPFFGCVNPENCNESAHGWASQISTCECGAKRTNNYNQTHVEFGVWA